MTSSPADGRHWQSEKHGGCTPEDSEASQGLPEFGQVITNARAAVLEPQEVNASEFEGTALTSVSAELRSGSFNIHRQLASLQADLVRLRAETLNIGEKVRPVAK